MLNRRDKSKNFKFRRMFQKSLATALVSVIGLTSASVFTALNSGKGVSAYFLDDSHLNQTRLMTVNGNYLPRKKNCWMNVSLSESQPSSNDYMTYDATLRFDIPDIKDVDLNELEVYVSDRFSGQFSRYKITKEDPTVKLQNLQQSNYVVKVCKVHGRCTCCLYSCEFSAVDRNLGDKSAENYANILDANGNVIGANSLIYYKPSASTGTNMVYLKYPYSLIPYNSHCIKVVFFESESDRGGEPVNIVESLYDYDWSHYDDKIAKDVCFPCKLKSLSSGKTYEAHFYKDEVRTENFVSKVVGLKFK